MTDRIDENPTMISIPDQAAEWLLRWHCGDVTIAERYEYLQWLKTSPVHIAEMLRMCRLYSWLENTKLNLYITNEDTFSNVVELPPREREAVKARKANRASLWHVSLAAGVAAIGLSALIGFAAKTFWFDHVLQTQASEWRSMPLSDGSSITAAPYTSLRHDIGDEERLIRIEEGKAEFRVAKDPSRRPFLVEAGQVVIRATGTQFGVESRDEDVRVTMREGTVIVTPTADSEATFTVSLEADEQMTVSGSGSPRIERVDADRVMRWADGDVILSDGNTIGDAVAQFNDYNDVKIVVDEKTSARQMRGRFDAIDPLSFADTVGQTAQTSVVRESPELIRIGLSERHR